MSNGFRQIWVWSFRLERIDAAGQPLRRVAVEMRGANFVGSIANGDVVEISADEPKGTVVQVSRARNLTTNSMVQASGLRRIRVALFFSTLIALVAVVAFGAAMFAFFQGF